MMTILKWALALLLGGFLILFGVTKFTGGAHIFPYIEYKATGLGLPFADLFFPVVNNLTGGLEILAGVLVILPFTRERIGSLLAIAPLAGAVVFHLSPALGVITPLGFSEGEEIAKTLAAGGPFLREHFTPETGPVLFAIACGMLLIAIVNWLVQQR